MNFGSAWKVVLYSKTERSETIDCACMEINAFKRRKKWREVNIKSASHGRLNWRIFLFKKAAAVSAWQLSCLFTTSLCNVDNGHKDLNGSAVSLWFWKYIDIICWKQSVKTTVIANALYRSVWKTADSRLIFGSCRILKELVMHLKFTGLENLCKISSFLTDQFQWVFCVS